MAKALELFSIMLLKRSTSTYSATPVSFVMYTLKDELTLSNVIPIA